MSTSIRPRSVVLVGALALGFFGSTIGPSCLIPDYCIELQTLGTNWCTQMEGALMWPPGQPELAEPVIAGDGTLPAACVCMNDGEDAILFDETPADEYSALVVETEASTRENCVNLVTPGYEHNCLDTEDGLDIAAPTLQKAFQGESSRACIGSCSYTGAPPFGECGPNPDPWACNGEDPPGTGDTGGLEGTGGGETGGTGGLGPGPSTDGRLAR